MPKELDNPLICILTCAFEPPKPKTKHNINLSSAEDYNKMIKIESDYFTNMVK